MSGIINNKLTDETLKACKTEATISQVKAVADLYALCWQSGEAVTYAPDSEKATI